MSEEVAAKAPKVTKYYVHVPTGRMIEAASAGAALNHIARQEIRIASQKEVLAAGKNGVEIEVAGRK